MGRAMTIRLRRRLSWAASKSGGSSIPATTRIPMHLHLVQFQVVERQGFNVRGNAQKGKVELIGTPRKPHANEAGWKDTAIVIPGDVLTILARFEGYTGRYVFHCHMLEHEDNDMMRPFEVVPVEA